MSSKNMIYAVSAFILLVMVVTTWGGTVILKDGRELEGKVIVRNDYVTISGVKLYQFPQEDVDIVRSASEELSILSKDVTIFEEPEEGAKVIQKFSRGLEVVPLEERDDWIMVRGWGNKSGWIPKNILTKEVILSVTSTVDEDVKE